MTAGEASEAAREGGGEAVSGAAVRARFEAQWEQADDPRAALALWRACALELARRRARRPGDEERADAYAQLLIDLLLRAPCEPAHGPDERVLLWAARRVEALLDEPYGRALDAHERGALFEALARGYLRARRAGRADAVARRWLAEGAAASDEARAQGLRVEAASRGGGVRALRKRARAQRVGLEGAARAAGVAGAGSVERWLAVCEAAELEARLARTAGRALREAERALGAAERAALTCEAGGAGGALGARCAAALARALEAAAMTGVAVRAGRSEGYARRLLASAEAARAAATSDELRAFAEAQCDEARALVESASALRASRAARRRGPDEAR